MNCIYHSNICSSVTDERCHQNFKSDTLPCNHELTLFLQFYYNGLFVKGDIYCGNDYYEFSDVVFTSIVNSVRYEKWKTKLELECKILTLMK